MLRRNLQHLIHARYERKLKTRHDDPIWINDENVQEINEESNKKVDEQVTNANLQPTENDIRRQGSDELLESDPTNVEVDRNETYAIPQRPERDRRPNSRFRDFFLFQDNIAM